MDKGPWHVLIEPEEGRTDWYVGSDDFSHDVWLKVTGDFKDDADRLAYCEWLAGVLNAATALQPAPDSSPASP